MTEIEIKAHVADHAATEKTIRSFASFVGDTIKSDVYWRRSPETAMPDHEGHHDAQTLAAAIASIMSFAFAVSAAVSVIAGADKRIAIGICLAGFAFTSIFSWALKRWIDRRRAQGGSAAPDADTRPVKVRIRDENGAITVTYKRKELQKDIEINDEREFSIDDRAAFEALIADLGFSPYSSKEKKTKTFAWTAPDKTAVSIELSLVTGLGWFVELEILANDPDDDETARARAALRETLSKCGVPESAIESRYYTDMLASVNRPTA